MTDSMHTFMQKNFDENDPEQMLKMIELIEAEVNLAVERTRVIIGFKEEEEVEVEAKSNASAKDPFEVDEEVPITPKRIMRDIKI